MIYPKRIEWQAGTTAHGKRGQTALPATQARKPRAHQGWHERTRASWLAQAR